MQVGGHKSKSLITFQIVFLKETCQGDMSCQERLLKKNKIIPKEFTLASLIRTRPNESRYTRTACSSPREWGSPQI